MEKKNEQSASENMKITEELLKKSGEIKTHGQQINEKLEEIKKRTEHMLHSDHKDGQ